MPIQSARVLVIDDSPLRRATLARRLEALGYGALLAESGQHGLALAKAEKPELMLLQINLPDVTSEYIIKQLKVDEELSSIIVLMLTSGLTTEGVEACLALGADDYLPEPFSPSLLKVQLTDYLGVRQRRIEERERLKREKVLNDVAIARRFQSDFLPKEVPQPKGWQLAAALHPAREVAGDWYDIFTLTQGRRIGIVIADVCDKGVGAALFMALSRSLTRAFAQQNYSLNLVDSLLSDGPALVSARPGRRGLPAIGATALKNAVLLTNNYIMENHSDLNMFATMFFGVLDPMTGGLVYINGGHNPPYIVGADGALKGVLKATGMAVGMMAQTDFRTGEAQLEPGDTLVMYTDGVPDARDPAGAQYTDKRLRELLATPAASAASLLERLDNTLRNHIADAVQFDDITIVIVRRMLPMEEGAVA